MAHTKFAKRYAKGLWDYANETNKTEEVYHEMKSIITGINESKDLRTILASPVLDNKRKKKLIDDIFKSYSTITQKFIHLIINHGRESNLFEIAKAYVNFYDNHKGLQKVLITSATELDKETIDKILKETDFVMDANPTEIETIIDPNILGGYIIRLGDQQMDASIKTKLNNLKKEFNQNLYVPKF